MPASSLQYRTMDVHFAPPPADCDFSNLVLKYTIMRCQLVTSLYGDEFDEQVERKKVVALREFRDRVRFFFQYSNARQARTLLLEAWRHSMPRH